MNRQVSINPLAGILPELDQLAIEARSADDLMQRMVRKLSDCVPKYNWVGFYLLEKNVKSPVLVLGPYVGAPTPHTRIPAHQGICGAAAASGTTIVVDDVNADPRYLACSLETKSEIVVPVYAHGKVVGELDIDSHTGAAFGPEDRALCERCAAIVGKYLETHAK
jgi:L-methionine (R)-S-oxide reductase